MSSPFRPPTGRFGDPGVRDPDIPCACFEPRALEALPGWPALVALAGNGDVVAAEAVLDELVARSRRSCEGDGHYLCEECRYWRYFGVPEKDRRGRRDGVLE